SFGATAWGAGELEDPDFVVALPGAESRANFDLVEVVPLDVAVFEKEVAAGGGLIFQMAREMAPGFGAALVLLHIRHDGGELEFTRELFLRDPPFPGGLVVHGCSNHVAVRQIEVTHQ